MPRNRIAKSNINRTANRCYCLVDGVLTPMVYQKEAEDGALYYDDLHITSPNRLSFQQGLRQETAIRTQTETTTTTVTKPTGVTTTTTTTTIRPSFVWDYTYGIESSSGLVSGWSASIGKEIFSQATSNLKPKLGERAGGVEGSSSVFFDGGRVDGVGDYMSTSANVTVSGDFTMFIYATPYLNKYMRFLGNSADANVYISFHATGDQVFDFGLGSGKTYSIDYKIANDLKTIESRKETQLTIQRSGTTLYLRKDGVDMGSTTVSTDDFVFNQIGRVGTATYTYGGYISHLSIYDGYISSRLSEMENSITIESAKSRKG